MISLRVVLQCRYSFVNNPCLIKLLKARRTPGNLHEGSLAINLASFQYCQSLGAIIRDGDFGSTSATYYM